MKKHMATKIDYVSPHAHQSTGPMASKVEESEQPKFHHYVLAIVAMLIITCSATLDTIQF